MVLGPRRQTTGTTLPAGPSNFEATVFNGALPLETTTITRPTPVSNMRAAERQGSARLFAGSYPGSAVGRPEPVQREAVDGEENVSMLDLFLLQGGPARASRDRCVEKDGAALCSNTRRGQPFSGPVRTCAWSRAAAPCTQRVCRPLERRPKTPRVDAQEKQERACRALPATPNTAPIPAALLEPPSCTRWLSDC